MDEIRVTFMDLEARSPMCFLFFFVNPSVKHGRQNFVNVFFVALAPLCRYATQNAKVLEEARTALATGEIRTPSLPSAETSEGGDSEGDAAEGEQEKAAPTAPVVEKYTRDTAPSAAAPGVRCLQRSMQRNCIRTHVPDP